MDRKLRDKIQAAAACGAFAIALVLVQHFEGTRYVPYRDSGGVLTVCEGITGKDVIEKKVYTRKECDELLKKHMSIAKEAVDKLVKVKLSDITLAALYSFTYNVGVDAFRESKLLKLINSNKKSEACEELKKWNKVKTFVIKGLMNRREIEEAVCKVDKVSEL